PATAEVATRRLAAAPMATDSSSRFITCPSLIAPLPILDQVRHEVQDFRTFRRRLAAVSWLMLLPLGDFAPACIRTENACWVKPISLSVQHRRACPQAHHLRNLGHAKTTHRSPQ